MTATLSLIDNARYPIHLPNTPDYQRLVEACRAELKIKGACLLPGFTTPEATAGMAEETDRIVDKAYPCRETHNVYMEKDDPSYPVDHPRRQRNATTLDVLACDQILPEYGLQRLYHWDPLLHFIADVLERKTYYRMADPLASLTVNVMHEGQNHGWHFDEAEVTTTLMLRKPESGGEFEYIHNLRTGDQSEYDGVALALNSRHPDVETLAVSPGTLVLFAGYYSLHQVTPVKGPTARYVATLCFKDQPNVCNSPEVQQLFYGRTV